MSLGWITVTDYPFDCFLLFERFQIHNLCQRARGEGEYRIHLGIALAHHPAVHWVFAHKCPEHAALLQALVDMAPQNGSREAVRASELFMLEAAEDFVIYCYPDRMDTGCDFIYNWDKSLLFEMADFSDKVVLDVGSGSGRLAFAAAEQARWVYASEPVDSLREYLREKIAREGIRNMRVVDGMAHVLPYPDDTFDIVMSGHVVGDDYDNEVAELVRVTKNGGWVLDCPGDAGTWKRTQEQAKNDNELIARFGFQEWHHVGPLGGDNFRYSKQVHK